MSNPEVEFGLSERGRLFAARLADNPLDLFQGKSLGWLEDFIRITVGSMKIGSGLLGTNTVGHMAWIGKDLTAQIGEYVYEDSSGQYLYLNGAEVSQTTYANLYEFYGVNAYGIDTGGNFFLPDSRGRSPFLCGTNSNADLGDNDGITLVLRQALHQHSITGTVASHSHDDGTLTVASHAHDDGTLTVASHSHSDGTLTVAAHSHGGGVHNHGISDPGHNHQYDVQDFAGGSDRTLRRDTGNAGTEGPGAIKSSTTGVTVNDCGTIISSEAPDVTGATGSATPDVTGSTSSVAPDVTGSTGSASPAVSGTAGSGMSLDAPAHIFIGSLVVRF